MSKRSILKKRSPILASRFTVPNAFLWDKPEYLLSNIHRRVKPSHSTIKSYNLGHDSPTVIAMNQYNRRQRTSEREERWDGKCRILPSYIRHTSPGLRHLWRLRGSPSPSKHSQPRQQPSPKFKLKLAFAFELQNIQTNRKEREREKKTT